MGGACDSKGHSLGDLRLPGEVSSVCMSALVAESCPALCNPMACSSPGSSVYGTFQASIRAFSRMSS